MSGDRAAALSDRFSLVVRSRLSAMTAIEVLLLLLPIALATAQTSKIDCKYSSMSLTDSLATVYTCSVANREVFGAEIQEIDTVVGEHQHAKSNDDVNGFCVQEARNLRHFPSGFEKAFKNLTAVVIYGTNLREVRQKSLKKLPRLRFLYLARCRLEVIEPDLLRFNAELEVLWLNDNKIAHIDPLAFSALKGLRVLDLSANKCAKTFGKAATREAVKSFVSDIEGLQCYSTSVNEVFVVKKTISEEIRESLERKNSKMAEVLEKLDEIYENLNNFNQSSQQQLKSVKNGLENLSNRTKIGQERLLVNIVDLFSRNRAEIDEKLSNLTTNRDLIEVINKLDEKILKQSENFGKSIKNFDENSKNFHIFEEKFSKENLLNTEVTNIQRVDEIQEQIEKLSQKITLVAGLMIFSLILALTLKFSKSPRRANKIAESKAGPELIEICDYSETRLSLESQGSEIYEEIDEQLR